MNVRFMYRTGCAVDPKYADTVFVKAVMSWSAKSQLVTAICTVRTQYIGNAVEKENGR